MKTNTDSDRLNGMRGNMQRCCEHAANGKSRVGLTRNEIVSNIRAGEKRSEIVAEVRARYSNGARVANVRRLDKGAAYHVIGLGRQDLTLNELKTKLDISGFTGYRVGGLVFKLKKG